MMKRALLLLCGVVQLCVVYGQHDAEHRLAIMKAVERSNSYFNSCMDRDGYQDDRFWSGFEALFEPNATLVNDVLILNQQDVRLRVDPSTDPIEKFSPAQIALSQLDYLQVWRHVYEELPLFKLEFLHVELDDSKKAGKCWVSKTMISPGKFYGIDEILGEKLADRMQQIYPLKMTYTLVQDGLEWQIREVTWSEGQSVPWHQFIQVTDGEGATSSDWNPSYWNWSETVLADSAVMEFEPGTYHVFSKSPEISLSYADPSFEGQKNCASAEAISVTDWCLSANEKRLRPLSQMPFAPAIFRLEGQLHAAPLSLLSLTDGVGEDAQYISTGVQFGIWKSPDKNPNSNMGWRFDIGGGRSSEVLQLDMYEFAEVAVDEDGDEYLRRTRYSSVNQSLEKSWITFDLGYERSNRSRLKPELWTGWRASVSAGAIKSNPTKVDYHAQISGEYQQYAGVEILDGVYDFGSSVLSARTANDVAVLWATEFLSVLRLHGKKQKTHALIASTGLRVQGASKSANTLNSTQVPNLLATSSWTINVLPVFRIGLSRLLVPSFDTTCPN